MIPPTLAIRAAEILEREAKAIRECHTRHGQWSAEDAAVEAEYHEMMAIALELRRSAGG